MALPGDTGQDMATVMAQLGLCLRQPQERGGRGEGSGRAGEQQSALSGPCCFLLMQLPDKSWRGYRRI